MIVINKIELTSFLEKIHELYDYDFNDYREDTLIRRIQIHAIQLNINDFSIYCEYILNNIIHFEEMFRHFSINVTEFFREPCELRVLRDKILPYLSTYAYIKIWYAGCSTGEQVYTLAIILEELGILHKTQIYATDFNNEVLDIASVGKYDKKCLEKYNINHSIYNDNSISNHNNYYFTIHNNSIKVKDYLKKNILFFNHNLTTDSSINEFQLIICTNVLIYFNSFLKQKVIKLFEESLCTNGFLMIGKNEFIEDNSLTNYKQYIYNKKVYQKCK